MPVSVELKTQALFDGKILPKQKDLLKDSLLYIEATLVTCDTRVTFAAYPFHPTRKDSVIFEVYGDTEMIAPSRLGDTNMPGLTRVPSGCASFEIHLYKVFFNKHLCVGYKRHISQASVNQDAPFWGPIRVVQNFKSEKPAVDLKHIVVTHHSDQRSNKFKPLDGELYVPSNHKYWMVQREFYSTMHCASSFGQRATETALLLEDFVFKWNASSLSAAQTPQQKIVTFIKTFVKAIFAKIVYSNDEKFSRPQQDEDLGDALLVFTRQGDCEDFAHYFISMLTQLMHIARAISPDVFQDKTNIATLKTLVTAIDRLYVPMAHICQIENTSGELEYHSTVLCVPKQKSVSSPLPIAPLGVELTSPDESDLVTSKTFQEWHKQNYFLLTSYMIYKFPRDAFKKIPEDLSTAVMESTMINY